nr:gametogenetin-like [Pongo pygmaeus]
MQVKYPPQCPAENNCSNCKFRNALRENQELCLQLARKSSRRQSQGLGVAAHLGWAGPWPGLRRRRPFPSRKPEALRSETPPDTDDPRRPGHRPRPLGPTRQATAPPRPALTPPDAARPRDAHLRARPPGLGLTQLRHRRHRLAAGSVWLEPFRAGAPPPQTASGSAAAPLRSRQPLSVFARRPSARRRRLRADPRSARGRGGAPGAGLAAAGRLSPGGNRANGRLPFPPLVRRLAAFLGRGDAGSSV